MYSTLCQGEEDAGGAEFVVMRMPDGDTVMYEFTEGAIMAPLLAYGPDVKIDERTGEVEFRFLRTEVPGKPQEVRFVGTITNGRLSLETEGQSPMSLPRVLEMGDQIPECKPLG